MAEQLVEPNLYGGAQIYDILFAEPLSQAAISFYSTLIRQFGEPVLELACGTGRVTIALAALDFKVHGLDNSVAMIEQGKRKTRQKSLDISYFVQDMRDFAINQKFGLIFIPHQSFQHLYTREDVAGCLRSVRKHLLPEGAFLIQVFNPWPPLLTTVPKRFKTSKEYYQDPQSGERYYAEYENQYNPGTQILTSTYYYHTERDPTERCFQLKMRQFFPQELDDLIESNGFKILAKYGDEKFTPFDQKPNYQNILCRPK